MGHLARGQVAVLSSSFLAQLSQNFANVLM